MVMRLQKALQGFEMQSFLRAFARGQQDSPGLAPGVHDPVPSWDCAATGESIACGLAEPGEKLVKHGHLTSRKHTAIKSARST